MDWGTKKKITHEEHSVALKENARGIPREPRWKSAKSLPISDLNLVDQQYRDESSSPFDPQSNKETTPSQPNNEGDICPDDLCLADHGFWLHYYPSISRCNAALLGNSQRDPPHKLEFFQKSNVTCSACSIMTANFYACDCCVFRVCIFCHMKNKSKLSSMRQDVIKRVRENDLRMEERLREKAQYCDSLIQKSRRRTIYF